MKLTLPSPEDATHILRALYSAAVLDGPLTDREGAMLEAAREVTGVGDDVDIHRSISPVDFGVAVTDPQLRHQAVTAMVIMSLLDEDGSREDAGFIEGYAEELGVMPDELRNLRQMAEGQTLRFQLDIARRVWLMEHLREKWETGGLRWLARAAGTKLGLVDDTALADRYRALVDYPEGTVGQQYYVHMREQGFPLPGEKGSQVEPVIIHDMMHLLSGYGTDPKGEILTASFSAGNRRQDPFTYIFFVLCQFHLGNLNAPFAPRKRGQFDAGESIRAVRRGMEVSVDLSSGWDPWSIFGMTLDEARESLSVPPA
ncbi:MAG: hypothetical protein ACI8S6_001883 [Myxococcota bacterium]|jgi:hypothetical protein